MKGHISLTGNYEQFVMGDVRTPGKRLTKSVIILYQKKKHTIRCVEFGLLICLINAQLHSPLLGYCLLKEWDKLVWEDIVTLIFPKINETWWLFEWTAFTKHFSLENFTSYVWFGMYTNKHLNSFWFACCLNVIRVIIYFMNNISKILSSGNFHSPSPCVMALILQKHPNSLNESVQTALSRTATHIYGFLISSQMW